MARTEDTRGVGATSGGPAPTGASFARSVDTAASSSALATLPAPTGMTLARTATNAASARALARTAAAGKRIVTRSAAAEAAPESAVSDRPHLSLVETPQPRPTQPPRAAAPQIARSSVDTLAAVTGSSVESGEGGLRTVHFPTPETGALTPQPYSVSREFTDSPAPSSEPAAHGAAPEKAGDHANPADEAAKREELYDYFLDRFKRDLLAEREQMGHLVIDNP
jgi:hypothetical protein